MMRFFFIILALSYTMVIHAEMLWKNGETWSVNTAQKEIVLKYQFSDTTTTLSGKDYSLLSRKIVLKEAETEEEFYNDTLGFFRSDVKDSLVYAIRHDSDDEKEYLLFDLKNKIEYKNPDFWKWDTIGIVGHIFTEILDETPTLAEPTKSSIWTEGSFWRVEYEGKYTIEYSISDNSIPILEKKYNLLIRRYLSHDDISVSFKEDTIALIRSEHEDSLIYAIWVDSYNQEEYLLYDFRKKFEYGDSIFYGVESVGIVSDYITPGSPELKYYYDVIEQGDTLPAWKGLVYQIGHIRGPVALFVDEELDFTHFPDYDKSTPKPTNISHTLFGSKGKPKGEITTFIEIICLNDSAINSEIYNLNGSSGINLNGCTIFIHEGRKYMMLQRR